MEPLDFLITFPNTLRSIELQFVFTKVAQEIFVLPLVVTEIAPILDPFNLVLVPIPSMEIIVITIIHAINPLASTEYALSIDVFVPMDGLEAAAIFLHVHIVDREHAMEPYVNAMVDILVLIAVLESVIIV